MKLFENYNSAVGKYGEPLVRIMLSAGIPNRYLLYFQEISERRFFKGVKNVVKFIFLSI